MTTNIGAQAAEAVNEKLLERQKLEQEMYAHHQDLQKLISQRNENEMVKTVRKAFACTVITWLFILVYHDDCFIYLIFAAVGATYLYHLYKKTQSPIVGR